MAVLVGVVVVLVAVEDFALQLLNNDEGLTLTVGVQRKEILRWLCGHLQRILNVTCYSAIKAGMVTVLKRRGQKERSSKKTRRGKTARKARVLSYSGVAFRICETVGKSRKGEGGMCCADSEFYECSGKLNCRRIQDKKKKNRKRKAEQQKGIGGEENSKCWVCHTKREEEGWRRQRVRETSLARSTSSTQWVCASVTPRALTLK
jgi:hypothetical protein